MFTFLSYTVILFLNIYFRYYNKVKKVKLSEYIDQLLAMGKSTFSLDDAQKALEKSRAAVILSIEHLKQQQRIVSPAKGFYVIVLPEYRVYGCLPAEYFIPYLFDFWRQPYYACLVTAASYYGAAHQQPQVFQIMIRGYRAPIVCEKVKVDFVVNKYLEKNPTQEISTARSKLRISTPETTAMDLLNYPKHCGGLNRVVTILDELKEVIKEKELATLLDISPNHFWKQRLGYIFEKLGAENLSQIIFHHITKLKRVDYIQLDPSYKENGIAKFSKNSIWKVIENTNFESDL